MLAVVIVDNKNDCMEIWNKHKPYLPDKCNVYINTSINSINEYNALLTSAAFWDSIIEENVLIIQHDSELLRKGIEEFYEYDYIGAAWSFYPFVGNGGLSFRKKSAMLKVIQHVSWTNNVNEDIFFAIGCKLLNLKLAPIEMANKFSVETQFHLGSMGCHAIDKYLTIEQTNQIRKQYE